ncbi:hypothetical protein [Magnetovibrio blakemorei]|uniref:hypothetical protein n=1 Tax=Magnetovibrio blakemorei TaxID=28181 RepID=UPI001112E40B|nr:hypothetical protein [Magnetovibrio blakemorei]
MEKIKRRRMKHLLFAPLRHPVLAVLLIAVVAALAASVLRDQLIEPEMMGAVCRSGTPPWWCGGRSAIITINGAGVYGYAALALALVSLVLKGRWQRWGVVAVITAAGFGGAGLFLYNAYLSASGLLVAVLSATRHEQTTQLEPDLAQPRQREQD